jgi:hypothetical protein
MKNALIYLLIFIGGFVFGQFLPFSEPEITQDPELKKKQQALELNITNLQEVIKQKNSRIDSLEVKVDSASSIIDNKQIQYYEKISHIDTTSVSDDASWLTNRFSR